MVQAVFSVVRCLPRSDRHPSATMQTADFSLAQTTMIINLLRALDLYEILYYHKQITKLNLKII